ncbi:MAG TPA: insulinase family protein, partial [Deltaproteobacteria bacterium]|nr:insulinase family protein [Deltaproteobacteria bacterium]
PAAPEFNHDLFEKISTKPFFGSMEVERWKLSTNDLSVLLVHEPSSDTIAYHTYFDVGSSDEVVGKTGLAHLFEHMM